MTSLDRFQLFFASPRLRRIFLAFAITLGSLRLLSMTISALGATAQSVPFTLCKESTTWTRPDASQQARIWNDARYSDHGAKAYEWNHDFLLVPTDSASIQYHMENEAGLWTEGVSSGK